MKKYVKIGLGVAGASVLAAGGKFIYDKFNKKEIPNDSEGIPSKKNNSEEITSRVRKKRTTKKDASVEVIE